jgi:predicted Fe-S protein YdhL (DUF1289 family)
VKKEALTNAAIEYPGRSGVETPTSRCAGSRREKARAPIAGQAHSVHCGKTQQNYAQSMEGAMRQVPSPCTGVCRIDHISGFCEGCLRTLDEIADWPMLSAAEKKALLERLRERQL